MVGRWSAGRTPLAALFVANAVPLVGVLFFGWDLHSLLVGYWLESGVLGTAFVAKIRRAEGEDDPGDLPAVSINGRSLTSFVGRSNREVAVTFVAHYGLFWMVHGAFVLAFPAVFAELDPASPTLVGVAVVTFAASHVVSYRVTYVGEREYERTGPVTLMVEPYRRVLVLHATVLLGVVAVAVVGTSTAAVAVLVAVKTALDARGHWREHYRERAPEAQPG